MQSYLGLILNKSIKWIVFHGCYDFGYLLRQLRAEPLPKTAEEFYKSVRIYFPNIYDIKHIVREEDEFKQGGLNNISEKIGVACVLFSALASGPSTRPAAIVSSPSRATSV